MIENWKKAYKFFSVQLLAVLIVLAGLEPFVPQISAFLPEHWVPYFGAVILFSRLISQSKKPLEPANVWDAAMKARESVTKVGCVFLLLACAGCTEPRHPERDSCYLAADQAAAQAYLVECFDYPDTRACPHGDAIEGRHGAALEACK